ncbi:aspartate/glutamate racemase family protein [Variovorax robiniae]|uniref:Aspartate/glutamate racemase family protein n=1 Tax=Variovorax robiniae TaxID=1836199 RepID=A0ABU8X003_9BURK
MRDILLINPNSSEATTTMMVRIARAELPAEGFRVTGVTASRGPSMIVNEAELGAAGLEVERTWRDGGTAWDGVIISAFGDPGIERVRRTSRVPVVGICEASMLEAAFNGRRFGVATVTPDLVAAIDGRALKLGLEAHYTGVRLTEGDPRALAADPKALDEALAAAVRQCIDEDGAEAVIIGGGPLGQAAINLAGRFGHVPLIAPIPAAVRRLRAQMRQGVGAVSEA